MTLVLELPPDVEQALQNKARRRGMALENLALDVLAREAKDENGAGGDNDYQQRMAAWLKQVEATHQRIDEEIASGSMKPVTSDDVTRAIEACRDARQREILAAAGITMGSESADAE